MKKLAGVCVLVAGIAMWFGVVYGFGRSEFAFFAGTNSHAVFGSHQIRMARGWFVYAVDPIRSSATLVKGGLFSYFSTPGHIHIKFLTNPSPDFVSKLERESTPLPPYTWGKARLLNATGTGDQNAGVRVFVPANAVFIDALSLENIDEIAALD